MTSTYSDRLRGVNAGKAIKVPCIAASTANLTLSGIQTVDGVVLAEDDRVLVKNQSDATENGIYDVSSGSWSRSPDWDGIGEVVEGTLAAVSQGTSNADTIWKVSTTGDITPGTTSVALALASLGALGTTSDLVTHDAGVSGSTPVTLLSRLNKWYYLTDFAGVDPTGAVDSTTGINNALTAAAGSTLFIPEGEYLITAKLSVPANTTVIGANWGTTKIIKGANIDMVGMDSYSQLINIQLDGDGANFTGKGCYITTGVQQTHRDVVITNCQDMCLEFDDEVGSQFFSIDSHYIPIIARDITVQNGDDSGAGQAIPKYFFGMQLGGGAIHVGTCVDFFIQGCFFNDIQFGAGSFGCSLINSRIASELNDVTIKGLGHIITGNSFSDDVVFDAGCRGVYYANNSAASVTWAPSSGTYCSVSHPKQDHTPVLDQLSGTAPTIGNGSLAAEFSREGMTCTLNLYLVYGSTSTAGDGADGWTFSLPYPASQNATIIQGGPALIEDVSTGTYYPVQWTVSGSVLLFYNGTGWVKAGNPMVWQTGDRIILNISYHTDR